MKRIFKLINMYKTVFVVVLFISLIVHNVTLRNDNIKLEKSIEIQMNNVESYRGIVSNVVDSNTALQLELQDIHNSHDAALQRLDSVMKVSNIPGKDLKIAASTKQEINISVADTIHVADSCEFTKTLKPNELTFVTIHLKSDSLKCDIKINNEQWLYIYNKRRYKNENKKFFKRLFTLDFKKINTTKYKIVNSNDLITVGETRVIEIIE